MILDCISFHIFIISFSIGLFFAYILGPEKKTIYIYPSPDTVNTVLFKDRANNCFSFEEEIVECPSNENEISVIPIQ
jgi:hypothetical protein